MEYDNWKSQTVMFDEEVSSCCGTEGDGYECSSCGDEVSYISDAEYKKEAMYSWSETLRD
jgi:hypothetical protein